MEYDSNNTKTRIKRLVKEVISDSEDSINQRIDERFSNLISPYKWVAIGFVSGLTLFVSAGVLSKGVLFETLISSMYPPDAIVEDTYNLIAENKQFREELFKKTDFADLTIRSATFETFPSIEEAMPSKIWQHVVSGDEEKYKELVTRPEFFNALKEYHEAITLKFISPSLRPAALADEILNVGEIPYPIKILIGSEELDNQPTSTCRELFQHEIRHAILVVPMDFPREELSWLNCSFGWPSIFLEIAYPNLDNPIASINDVQLVGLRRSEKSAIPFIIVSQKVAEEIELPGWETFESNMDGAMRVSRVIQN